MHFFYCLCFWFYVYNFFFFLWVGARPHSGLDICWCTLAVFVINPIIYFSHQHSFLSNILISSKKNERPVSPVCWTTLAIGSRIYVIFQYRCHLSFNSKHDGLYNHWILHCRRFSSGLTSRQHYKRIVGFRVRENVLQIFLW